MPEPDQRDPPSRTSASSPFTRICVAASLALLTAWSLRPFFGQLGFWPLTIDGVWWVSEYTVFQPEWPKLVFASEHGTGYRPVAALSYLLDHAIGGFSPVVYRSTDLALHAMGGILVFVLLRRLARDLPAWGAIVAAGIFLTHPVTKAVVPILDTRSYMLATVLGLGSLIALTGALETGRSRGAMLARSAAAAALLGCSLLSNESAFAMAGIVPFLALYAAWPRPDRWRAALHASIAPLAVAAGAFAARAMLVEGLGGYADRRLNPDWFLPIWEASWRTVGALPLKHPLHQNEIPAAVAAVLGVAVAYHLWRVVGGFARARQREPNALPVVLALWALGCSLMYAGLGVWFRRLAYPMLPPLSMLLGLVLVQTTRQYRGRWLLLAAHLAPQLFLLGYVLHESPAVAGPHPGRTAQRAAVNRLIDDMARDLERVAEPATVRLVIPYRREPDIMRFRERPVEVTPGLPRNHAVPGYLMRALLHDRDIVVENFVFFETLDIREPRNIRFRTVENRPAVRLPSGQIFYVIDAGRATRTRAGSDAWIWLDQPPLSSDRNHYVYVASGGEGRLDLVRMLEPRRARPGDPH